MIGEREPNQKCTEIGFETDFLEYLPTDADRKHETEQQHQFPVPGVIEHPAVQGSGEEDRRNDQEGPRRWRLVDCEGEEDNGEEVLHDERADRKATLQRTDLVPVFEGFHGEHRAAE